MRQFRIPFALLAGFALVFACETPDQPEQKPEIKIPSESQTIFSSGIHFPESTGSLSNQTATVAFTATDTWMADVTDTKASSWLSVKPTSGGAGDVNMTVTAKPNTGEMARGATVSIKCGPVSKSFTVTQAGTPPAPPSNIPVESVSLSKTELSLNKGQTETLVATVLPENATDKNVIWSSSDATVASVGQDGMVTALKSGTATITAKAGEKSATCSVVVSTPVDSITVDSNSITLEEGQSTTLTATISPNDADDQKVEWSTSDAKVATVDQNGRVTAVKEGSTTVTAKAGEKSAICTVTVTKPSGGEPFSLTPTSVELEADGGTFTVTVTCSTTYHINSEPDWVTDESVSGKVHTFSVPANTSTEERSGVIVFCDDQGTCLPCTVKQKAAETSSLDVNVTSLSFEAGAGTRTFTITSNQSWTVSSSQSWCQVSPSSGSNNGAVIVSASANGSSDARNATITVTVPGESLTKTISVSQAGASSQESFDWSQTFYHRSLMMRFTATWCGWCPRMNKSVHLAQEQNPRKIEALNLHGGGSDLVFFGTDVLMNQYGIGGFPTGILDGRRLIENYDMDYTASLIGRYLLETEQNYPVSSAMSYTSSWSGQNLSVDVALYLRYAANYKVTVVLLEDDIINQQSDNEEGYHSAYTHERIARMALSNISGDAFSTSQNETINHFNYSVKVPSSYNKSNLKILVYVQREFGSQIVLQSGNYGSYYVDNCASGVAGGSLAPTVVGQAGGGNEGITPGGDINMQ